MYQPKQITKESIRNNENAPSVIPRSNVLDVSISPNVYFFILEDYHDYVYLITHHLQFMLTAQFRKIFGITESAARHRYIKLVRDDDRSYRNEEEKRRNKELSIMKKKEYKGNGCIFPTARAFTYSEVNFPEQKKNRLVYDPSETALFIGLMKTEYWLQYNELIVDDLDFLPDFLPPELLRKEPFYNHKAFFWMIENIEGDYNHDKKAKIKDDPKSKNKVLKGNSEFAQKNQLSKALIDKEVPKKDIEALDQEEKQKNREKNGPSLLEFGLSFEKKRKLEKENEFDFRFRGSSPETKKQYVSEINRAAFETLQGSDVFVTKVKELKRKKDYDPQFEYHIVIFHAFGNGPSRYNRIITALQTITCYQFISIKLNITVVSHSEKATKKAYYAWDQAVKRRYERTDRVNLESRARNYNKKINEGKIAIGLKLKEKDIEKYCKTSTKFCRINEVNFINLDLEKYYKKHDKFDKSFKAGEPEFM
jgi:hypothetical protein